MNAYALYAIVKFRPYVETDEFANIGVVLCVPELNYFDYKVQTKFFTRINKFFDSLDKNMIKKVVQYIEDDLASVKDYALSGKRKDLASLFRETVKNREGIYSYTETRVKTVNQPEIALTQLYEHYVNHSFVKEDGFTTKLEKRIAELLRENNIYDCLSKDVSIQNNLVKLKIPFAKKQNNDFTHVVKPVSFKGKSTTDVIDFGSSWSTRFELLMKSGEIKPETVLLAVEKSDCIDESYQTAEDFLFERFDNVNIKVVSSDVEKQVLEFVR